MSAQSTRVRSNVLTAPSGNSRQLSKRGHAIGQYSDDLSSVVMQTAKGLNAIRKMINTEFKYADLLNVAATATQAGNVFYVSGVVQGLDLNNRVGDSIKLQHIYFNYSLLTGAVNANVRVQLLRDAEQRGVDPIGSDIMSNAGTAGVVVSHLNYINGKRRFHILYDEIHALNTVQEVSSVASFSTSHSGHILYRGTTAGSASAAEGSLYVVFYTDVAATAPVANFNLRITFTDD